MKLLTHVLPLLQLDGHTDSVMFYDPHRMTTWSFFNLDSKTMRDIILHAILGLYKD
jgi:hypothetical protein